MNDSEAIAAFIARRGIRKIPVGARAIEGKLDVTQPHPPTRKEREESIRAAYRARCASAGRSVGA